MLAEQSSSLGLTVVWLQAAKQPELRIGMLLTEIGGQGSVEGLTMKEILGLLSEAGRPLSLIFDAPPSTQRRAVLSPERSEADEAEEAEEQDEADYRAELEGLLVSSLHQRATEARIDSALVASALDAEDARAALVRLLLDHGRQTGSRP